MVIGGTGERVTLQASWDDNTSGASYVTAQGYLRLPARIRQRCGLWPGDRVLLAADPSDYVGQFTAGALTTRQKLADAIAGFEDAGCDELILMPCNPDLTQVSLIAEAAEL